MIFESAYEGYENKSQTMELLVTAPEGMPEVLAWACPADMLELSLVKTSQYQMDE